MSRKHSRPGILSRGKALAVFCYHIVAGAVAKGAELAEFVTNGAREDWRGRKKKKGGSGRYNIDATSRVASRRYRKLRAGFLLSDTTKAQRRNG